jgi:hypothetical protein
MRDENLHRAVSRRRGGHGRDATAGCSQIDAAVLERIEDLVDLHQLAEVDLSGLDPP